MLRRMNYNDYNNSKIFVVPCCGSCRRTNRNGCCTPCSQVEEILCVNELILIVTGTHMWFTRDYDSCWLQCLWNHRLGGTSGSPLWQGACDLTRAANEEGTLQETQFSQKSLKWYIESTAGFFARTGTIWKFWAYISFCVYSIPYCISLAIVCMFILKHLFFTFQKTWSSQKYYQNKPIAACLHTGESGWESV